MRGRNDLDIIVTEKRDVIKVDELTELCRRYVFGKELGSGNIICHLTQKCP